MKKNLQESPSLQELQVKHFKLEETAEWMAELQKNGCVVIKSVMSEDEVDKSQDAFWEWLEGLGSGLKRSDPATWRNEAWPGLNDMGFFVSYGGCHTKTSWMVRTNQNVQRAFKQIWKTEHLITSFDTIISWRPWWNKLSKGSWHPYVQNLHLDQNPYFKKGLKCVQGMVPLKRVRKDEIGGLRVVLGSNQQKIQDQVIDRYPQVTFSQSDWLELKANDPLCKQSTLVECDAGDLILWDSRTIHGGKICQPNEEYSQKYSDTLVRLAVTVTMVPRKWASEQVLQKRKKQYEKKVGTTHWPQEARVNGMGKMAPEISKQKIIYSFEYPELTEKINQLL